MEVYDMNIKNMFSKNLHKAISERGIKQVELAKAVKVPPTTVSGWFRGVHYPDLDKLMEICRYLDIPVGDLLGDPKHYTLYSMDDDFEKLAKVTLMEKEYIEKLEKALERCDDALSLWDYIMTMKKAGVKELTIRL